MKTNDHSKVNQMSGEWSTALSLVHNIGHLVKIEHFPAGSKCVVCGNPATNAEHLVDKGRGGDCTCLLYTSPSPRYRQKSRMPSSA